MSTFNIRKFDSANLKPHRIILVLGKRGTGKSTLIRDIMYHLKDQVQVPLAMTPTEESITMFEDCMPASCVYTDFRQETLDKLIDHQRKCGREKKVQKNVLLVLDDMMFDAKRVLKTSAMRDVFMNGRHLKLTFVNAMQYCMDMGPDLRSQIDYVFALRENIVSNRVKLYKYFFGGFETYDDFSGVFSECTSDNECLVIDNTVKSNRVSDMVFWYKADIGLPKYHIGSRKIWRLHNRYYHTEDELQGQIDDAVARGEDSYSAGCGGPRRGTHIGVVAKQN